MIIPITSIEIRGRQRKDIAPGPLNDLMESILKVGLLHPPVCWFDKDTSKWVLSVGERRIRAIQKINTMTPVPAFHCGTRVVIPGHIAIQPLGDYLDEIGRFEAELDENIRREDISWQDRCKALSDLHEMRLKLNPTHTASDTGREIAQKGAAKSEAAGREQLRVARIISEHLHDEKISGARNAEEALQLIYKAEEEKAVAALVKRRLSDGASNLSLSIVLGNLLVEMPKLTAETIDLVICDPPYGIQASGQGFRSRTIHHHNYEDDPETAKNLAKIILREGFRAGKPRANLFMFCDIDLFPYLRDQAAAFGWVPFRRPLIWQKSDSEGLAPWGGQGPRITTEFIFYATKGQRGLNASPIDVFRVNRVPRTERLHAAEKPVELLQRLIECSTLPGDMVLDPCCGSGSTLVACRESKRAGIGIELDPTFYNTAMTNVHKNLVA